MFLKKIASLPILLLLIISGFAQTPQQKSLPRSTPEAEAVSSRSILNFLEEAAGSSHEFHSIMILRHGKVVAEGWWNPYRPDLHHTMYSVSKSFTATAIGLAVAEKRLTVNDKVISFFPDQLPDTVGEFLAALTVKDLLTMSVGQDPDPSAVVPGDTNWVRAFLRYPIKYKPGTKFLYNSMATYMLSAIVQKLTGEKVVDYLRPRLFEPLGITGADWETDPKGINVGGWGLRVKTEDMAKFGQLFLQKGKWNNQQLLPEWWVEEASTKKIDQNPDATAEAKNSNDWLQGYCYQMWRCRNNAYRGDGAFGQYIIVMPDQDAVIAITSETSDMGGIMNMVWKHLLPAFKNEPLPSTADTRALAAKLNTLSLKLPAPASDSAVSRPFAQKTYTLQKNERGYQSISFQFKGNTCDVKLNSNTGTYPLKFGARKWEAGTTTKLGPSLVLRARNHFAGLPPSKIVGAYVWKNSNTLQLQLRYIDSPHTETLTCQFNGDRVSIDVQNSFEKNKKYPEIIGEVKR